MNKHFKRKKYQRLARIKRTRAAGGGRAHNENVTPKFLEMRAKLCMEKGYPKQKWIWFCEELLERGFEVNLYEAKNTFSKYLTVQRPGANEKTYRIRFSNHAPNENKERMADCDFFVGHTNFTITTALDALRSTLSFFGEHL